MNKWTVIPKGKKYFIQREYISTISGKKAREIYEEERQAKGFHKECDAYAFCRTLNQLEK